MEQKTKVTNKEGNTYTYTYNYQIKNLRISEDVHRQLKVYCSTNGLKINHFVEETLLKAMK